MLLLIYLVGLFLLFNLRKPFSPGYLLIALYIFSIACGILIGNDCFPDSPMKLFNLIFLAGMVSLLILPWNRFNYKFTIAEPNQKRLKTLTLFLFIVNTLAFLFFSIMIFYAFMMITDYSAFKNDGGSDNYLQQLPVAINHTLLIIVLYLHPTSYFLVPLHFHYLIKKNYLYSVLSLILSLNIILNGLTIFSRSGFLAFFFLYGMYLPFYYHRLSSRGRNAIKAVALVLLSSTGFVFYTISANRFTEILAYKEGVHSQAYIKNPVVFSLFDYFSQWYNNSNEVMSLYSFETLNGELSFPFLILIAEKLQLIDYAPGELENRLYSLWGSYFDKFNGIVAYLLFDFGYLGAFLFILSYWLVMRKLRPVNGLLPFNNMLILGVLFSLPAMGIFNSQMNTVFFNLLIPFSLIIYYFLKRTNARNPIIQMI